MEDHTYIFALSFPPPVPQKQRGKDELQISHNLREGDAESPAGRYTGSGNILSTFSLSNAQVYEDKNALDAAGTGDEEDAPRVLMLRGAGDEKDAPHVLMLRAQEGMLGRETIC